MKNNFDKLLKNKCQSKLYSIKFKMVKKLKYTKILIFLKKHKNSILLIGNFDGLHLGHQKLFNLAKKYKKKKNLK